MEGSSTSGYRWNIAVDGSDAALNAFNIVFEELKRDDDYIIVSHVFSNDKKHPLIQFKQENIKLSYEGKLIGTHSSKWTMIWEHLEKNLTTKEHVNKIAKDMDSDIMAMGYVGRKGPKSDPTLLGSAVEYMAHNPVCPALIVKSPEKRVDKESGGFRWLVCSDGSEKSYKALRETLKIISKDDDEVVILVVTLASIDAKQIQEDTNKIFDEEGVSNHRFETLDRDSDEKTSDAIVDYINIDETEYIDFVVVSNQGCGYSKHTQKKYLGKVASGVLSKSKANIVLVF